MEKEKFKKHHSWKLFEQAFKMEKKLPHMNKYWTRLNNNYEFYKDHFDDLEKANTIIENAKYTELYKLGPKEVLKRVVSEEYFGSDPYDNLPNTWDELFDLKCTETAMDRILLSTKIEKLKKQFAELDKSFSFEEYDKKIDKYSFEQYEEEYNDYVKKKEKIKELHKLKLDLWSYKNYHLNKEDRNAVEKIFEEYNEEKLNLRSDWETINKYFNSMKHYKNIAIKDKNEMARRYGEIAKKHASENEERNDFHESSHSNSNSNKDDNKKIKIKLCDNCKNTCVGCKKNIKTSERVWQDFFYHKKCSDNSCFICGKSKDAKERSSTYLCKSCYNSNKFDRSKCIECHKQF